jgi:hypothetical protein
MKYRGYYLSNYHLTFYHRDIERVIQYNITTGTLIASYTAPTAVPTKIRYIYTPDQLKIFAFYGDLNYFFVRALNSNLTAFASVFTNPYKVFMPGSGSQCACFSADYKSIYILDAAGRLLSYNIAIDSLSTVVVTNYSGITDCYLDNPAGAMVFVKSTLSGTTFYNYDLETFVDTNQTSHSGKFFHLDSSFRYYTLTTNVTELYRIGTDVCTAGFFLDYKSQTCAACPNFCTICINNLICTVC